MLILTHLFAFAAQLEMTSPRSLASEIYSHWAIVSSKVSMILRLAIFVEPQLVTEGQTEIYTQGRNMYHT